MLAPGLLTYQVAVVAVCGTRLYLLPVFGSVIVSDPPLPAMIFLIATLGSGGLNAAAILSASALATAACAAAALSAAAFVAAALSAAALSAAALSTAVLMVVCA